MNLLDATRAHGDSSGILRVEDRRTRYFAFAIALTSVFVATSLTCHALGLRGAPGRPGMFLVDGIFGIARGMGFLPAIIATFLLLGSSAIALVTNASFFSLGMRAIEAATSGFLISVLMGSLGHADGGSIGLLLGERLSRMMSVPIATLLCGITTVLAVWLVIEGNMRECARVRPAPRDGLLGVIASSVISSSVISSSAISHAVTTHSTEASSQTQRETLFSTAGSSAAPGAAGATTVAPPIGESPSSDPSSSDENAIAVLPEAPPADPEVRFLPRRPRWREAPPEESVETTPKAGNTQTHSFASSAGVEVFVREPDSPETIAKETRIDEPNQNDVAESSSADSAGNAGDADKLFDATDGHGSVGVAELPRSVGRDLVGELESPAILASDEGIEGFGEGRRRRRRSAEVGGEVGGEVESAAAVSEERKENGESQEIAESHENEVGELTQEKTVGGEFASGIAIDEPIAPDGTDGRGVREPGVIVLTVPAVTYVDTNIDSDNWDLPRTIPAKELEAPAAEAAPSAEVSDTQNELSPAAEVAEVADASAAAPAVTSAAAPEGTENTEGAVLDRAARLVLGEGRASISFLQRKLQVSFNDAQHVMAQLEAAGAVGPYRGNPSRDILLTLSQWEAQRPT